MFILYFTFGKEKWGGGVNRRPNVELKWVK